MEFQPRIFGNDLTKEQEEREERVFDAADLLRKHGYKAKVTKYIVTKPTDEPAGIIIE